MRKVILQIDVSLDGFVADKDDGHSWATSDRVMNQEASELLDTVDTILLGRIAYEQFATFWPTADFAPSTIEHKIARQVNESTKLIFSKTLDKVEWGTWNNARLISNNAVEVITKMKAESGKNMLIYAGAEIIRLFIAANMIDKYRVRFCPVILGEGKSMFPHLQDRINLKPIRTKLYENGTILTEYQRKE